MNWRRFGTGAAIVVVAVTGAATWWYRTVYLPPRFSAADPIALRALKPDARVRVTQDHWIVMWPARPEEGIGLIFYPGGEVAPEGYAEPLRAVAQAGYPVVIVPMPLHLAVLAPDRAVDVMNAYPAIHRWVVAGHSLGGAMAARFAAAHSGMLSGLLLWDAYPAEADSLVKLRLPVMQIHRLDPDGRPPESYRDSAHLLPPQAEIVPIAGASHLNYGRFIISERFRNMPGGASVARIPIDEQHARVAEATVAFLRSVAGPSSVAAGAP